MKALFFANLAPVKTGAFEALLCALARRFAEAGDHLEVVFGGEPVPEAAATFREAGLDWGVLTGWTDAAGREHGWRFAAAAPGRARAARPDVVAVHFGNELPALWASACARLTGCRAAWVWQQDQQIADPSFLARRLSRLGLLRTTFRHFVAVYEGGRRSLAERGIPADRISVIRNGVAESPRTRSRGWLRRELELQPEETLAAAVGSLISRKRVGFVLDALARARRRAPGLRLVVVGDGPERAALEARSAGPDLKGSVRFLGRRNDVRDILADADMLAHAAVAEGSAYAIPEAMAAAIPAVVTAAGAADEQVVDGISGSVVAAGDLDGFADRLAELALDRPARERMGAAARERWRELFRVETAARRYHELYRALA